MKDTTVTPYSALPNNPRGTVRRGLRLGHPGPFGPDSAHGFLFQHHAEFAADITGFLS